MANAKQLTVDDLPAPGVSVDDLPAPGGQPPMREQGAAAGAPETASQYAAEHTKELIDAQQNAPTYDKLARARGIFDEGLSMMNPFGGGIQATLQRVANPVAPVAGAIQQGVGAVKTGVNAYEDARKHGAGVMGAMGEGVASAVAPSFGINPETTKDLARQKDYLGMAEQAVPAIGATLAGGMVEPMYKNAQDIWGGTNEAGEKTPGATNPEALEQATRGRLGAAQVEGQAAIKRGFEDIHKNISDKYDQIRAKDEANPAPVGTGFQPSQVIDALKQRATEIGASLQTPNSQINKLMDDLGSLGNGNLSFAQMQGLRTRIFRMINNSHLNPTDASILAAGRDALTEGLGQRAAQLGESERFESGNNEYRGLTQFQDNHGHLLRSNRDPLKFWNVIASPDLDTDVMLQNMGKHGDALRTMAGETSTLRNTLATHGGSGFTGRLRSMEKQPAMALVGAGAGKVAGAAIAEPWVTEMLGASKGASFGTKMDVARALREGPQFTKGATQLSNIGATDVMPRMKPNAAIPSGPVNNPPARMSAVNPPHPDDYFTGAKTRPVSAETNPRYEVGNDQERLAQAMYRKPYAQLDAAQKEAVGFANRGGTVGEIYTGPERRAMERSILSNQSDLEAFAAQPNIGVNWKKATPAQRQEIGNLYNKVSAAVEEQSPRMTNNASGESEASAEAISRGKSEQTNGVKRFAVDSRSGAERPIIGGVDVRPGPYEHIVRRSPEGEFIESSGERARPYMKRPFHHHKS